jgi:RNA polymerase sigma-70 factor (ECF subfamily)
MDDYQLLAAWADGDSGAGDLLCRRYIDDLLVYFTALVGVVDRADLTHTTLERLIRSLHRFERRSSFRTYLFGIARNVFLEHLRARYRGPGQFDELTQSVRDLDGPTPSTGVRLLRTHQLLHQCLMQLPAEDQALLTLYVWHDLTSAELAEIFYIKEGTVRTRVSRIRKQLRQMMTEAELGVGDPSLASLTEEGVEEELRKLRELIAHGPVEFSDED